MRTIIVLALLALVLADSQNIVADSNIIVFTSQYGESCSNTSSFNFNFNDYFPQFYTVEFPISSITSGSSVSLKISPSASVGAQYVQLTVRTFPSNYSFSESQVVETSTSDPAKGPFGISCTLADSTGELSTKVKFDSNGAQSDNVDVSTLVNLALAAGNKKLPIQFGISLIDYQNSHFCYTQGNLDGTTCGLTLDASAFSLIAVSDSTSSTEAPETQSPSSTPSTTLTNTPTSLPACDSNINLSGDNNASPARITHTSSSCNINLSGDNNASPARRFRNAFSEPVCSGKGGCISGSCVCNVGYKGENCEIQYCIPASSAPQSTSAPSVNLTPKPTASSPATSKAPTQNESGDDNSRESSSAIHVTSASGLLIAIMIALMM